MNHQPLELFARFIERETGIVYSKDNQFQLEARLLEIARAYNLSGIEELYNKAQFGMDPKFRQMLIDLATNNQTGFFRDPKVFEVVKQFIFPSILSDFFQSQAHEKLRIWSAASSSGQEAYSLAILYSEIARTSRAPSFEVLATDISERILEKALTGRYHRSEVEPAVTPEYLGRYFTSNDSENWSVNPELKSKVKFRMLNLIEPWSDVGYFHLVFCRNILIYQNTTNKQTIIKKITNKMHPGAYLVLGSGENLFGISDDFETFCNDGVFYYRLKKKNLKRRKKI